MRIKPASSLVYSVCRLIVPLTNVPFPRWHHAGALFGGLTAAGGGVCAATVHVLPR
jgi:hypothetical protein